MTLSPAATRLQRRITHPILFRCWMLLKLPLGLFAGLRVRACGPDRCVTSVPYGWRTQNPFRSTYFAAQAMAAELSTGALVLLAAEDSGVPFSTLIVDMQATFGKKAADTTTFTCEQGSVVFGAMRDALATREARAFTVETVGRLPNGDEVSRFRFTWSMKPRSPR